MHPNVLFKNFSDEYRRLVPPNPDDYALNEPFTFMCWFKGKNSNLHQHICGHKNLGFSFCLTPVKSNSHLTAKVGITNLVCDEPIQNNIWYHLTLTWNGSNFKFYINSSLTKSLKSDKIVYGSDLDKHIWVYKNYVGSSSFQMTISDIGLWNRVIEESEIRSIIMCDNIDLDQSLFLDRVSTITDIRGHKLPQSILQLVRLSKDDAQCPFAGVQSSDSTQSTASSESSISSFSSDSSSNSSSDSSSNSSSYSSLSSSSSSSFSSSSSSTSSSSDSSHSSMSQTYSSTSQTPGEPFDFVGPLTDYPFIVPDGVYDLFVYVEAAKGGVGYPSAQGGAGAITIGRMPVQPGDVVLITAGNVGYNSGRPGNGGRDPGSGGGGGGGSKLVNGVKKVISGGGGGGGGKGGDSSTGGTGGAGTPSPEGGAGGGGGHGGQRTGSPGHVGTSSFTPDFDNTNTASGILNYPYQNFVNPNPGKGLVKIRWVIPSSNSDPSIESMSSDKSSSTSDPLSFSSSQSSESSSDSSESLRSPSSNSSQSSDGSSGSVLGPIVASDDSASSNSTSSSSLVPIGSNSSNSFNSNPSASSNSTSSSSLIPIGSNSSNSLSSQSQSSLSTVVDLSDSSDSIISNSSNSIISDSSSSKSISSSSTSSGDPSSSSSDSSRSLSTNSVSSLSINSVSSDSSSTSSGDPSSSSSTDSSNSTLSSSSSSDNSSTSSSSFDSSSSPSFSRSSSSSSGSPPMGVFISGGNIPVNTIDYVIIATTGNAANFGEISGGRFNHAVCASSTRGLMVGTGGVSHSMSYITFATLGGSTDYGDIATPRYAHAGCSDSDRGIYAGGNSGSTTLSTMDYRSISTINNMTSFGSLSIARMYLSAFSSTTRGIFGGGYLAQIGPVNYNTIDYVTIATTGNALDFGDLTIKKYTLAGCSNSTRGIFAGGYSEELSLSINVIEYVTIASTANATDFGDLTVARNMPAACCDSTRAIIGGGATLFDNQTSVNTIDYITIANVGNATDFGDLTAARHGLMGCSNAHGGL
jgi:hypothetical protein